MMDMEEKELGCYMGVFDSYTPGCGLVRTLVMSGVFTSDDLYMVCVRLSEEGVIEVE